MLILNSLLYFDFVESKELLRLSWRFTSVRHLIHMLIDIDSGNNGGLNR